MLTAKVVAAAIIEISYALFTRTWLRQHAQGVELELFISAFRVVTIVAYWFMFRDLILGRHTNIATLRHPFILVAMAAALAVPFLFRGWSPGGGFGTAIVYVLTSILVGVREELLYRGVVFNLVEPRAGTVITIVLSTIIFVVYHYGAQPLIPQVIAEIAIMSVVLGLIYSCSRSLLAVMALHSAYDAIWFLGPYLSTPLPDIWRLAPLLTALLFAILWQINYARQGGRVSH